MISDYSAVGSQRGEKARGTHLSFDEFSSLPSPARAHAKAAECPGFKPLHIQWINGLLLFLWARRDSGDAQAQNGMMGEREEAAGSGPSHSDLAVPFFFATSFFFCTHIHDAHAHTHAHARARPPSHAHSHAPSHTKKAKGTVCQIVQYTPSMRYPRRRARAAHRSAATGSGVQPYPSISIWESRACCF